MLETLHRTGSRIRNSDLLRRQTWLWRRVEPLWNGLFERASTQQILCEVHTRHLANCGGSPQQFERFVDELGYVTDPLDTPNQNGIYHTVLRRR